jgi:predicted DNA repair protein MutK
MATSLLALFDDIATVLDDVALLTKVAARKTAGVLGDDLAVNAEQVTGVRANRELPVVWAVFKGSMLNKAILVPAALLLSVIAPWVITPVLMAGGLFLCYEGFEKLSHKYLHPRDVDEREREIAAALADPDRDLAELERNKVKGAIRTDFVLSAEIVAITLGIVAAAPLPTRIMVLAGIAVLMTVGVYGLVAGIVKLDDAGLYLSKRDGEGAWPAFQRRLGGGILAGAPYLMKALSVLGMVAMFLVGGGILVHGIPALHHGIEHLGHVVQGMPALGGLFGVLANGLIGVAAGAATLFLVNALGRLRRRAAH